MCRVQEADLRGISLLENVFHRQTDTETDRVAWREESGTQAEAGSHFNGFLRMEGVSQTSMQLGFLIGGREGNREQDVWYESPH